MAEDANTLYKAFKAKDSRFDGRFFVGISSTGIYCRPVCRAKQPKAENCTFYFTAAEAEKAGYRPCLLCRPELAPGSSVIDASANLVYRAARMLEENCGTGYKLEDIAARLGCTDRHLRRVFTTEYHVSPIQYLQTCRLLLAKSLLTDTDLSILQVAMSAGFGSLRRFNDLFKKQYNLSPTALRKRTMEGKDHRSDVTLALGYRPPYRWKEILNFLSKRAIAGVEVIKNEEYMRTVRLINSGNKVVYGWIRVGHRPQKNVLAVTVSETLLSVLPQVLARVRHLFDLYCDPESVYETLSVMNNIRPGLCSLGTRLPGCFDAFEVSVRAILGRQNTVSEANALAAKIVNAYGTDIHTGIEGLISIFPSPEQILALGEGNENSLVKLGITIKSAKAIYNLAQALVEGKIDLGRCEKPAEETKKLMAIVGIENEEAQHIAMRVMAWPDAFFEADTKVRRVLSGYAPSEMLNMTEAWRPWRSYATINLWNSL